VYTFFELVEVGFLLFLLSMLNFMWTLVVGVLLWNAAPSVQDLP
jgi:hypothetical protein